MKEIIFSLILISSIFFGQKLDVSGIIPADDERVLITKKIEEINYYLLKRSSKKTLQKSNSNSYLHLSEADITNIQNLNDDIKMIKLISYNKEDKGYVVNCRVIYNIEGHRTQEQATISFDKNKNWKSVNNKILNEIKNQKIVASGSTYKTRGINNINDVTEAQIKVTGYTYRGWPLYEYEGEDIMQIDRYVTENYLDRTLFAPGASLDMGGYLMGYNGNEVSAVTFYLDKSWERIVYAEDNYGSYGAIKSFGDGNGNWYFNRPQALCVSDNCCVFVLDRTDYDPRVVKLSYSGGLLSLANSNFVNQNYLSSPVDIEYSNGYIFVSDAGRQSILVFNANDGSLYNEIKYLMLNGQQQPIGNPQKICIDGMNIVYIDGNICIYGAWQPGTSVINCIQKTIFPPQYRLEDIGQDGTGSFIIADPNNGLLHKLNAYGEYICSNTIYSGYNPIFCSKSPANSSGIVTGIYIYAPWDYNLGIRKVMPGSNVIDITKNEDDYNFYINYLITGESYYEVYIQTPGGDQLLIEQSTSGTGEYHTTSVSKQDMIGGENKWIIKYKSIYPRPPYENVGDGWCSEEVSFFSKTYLSGVYNQGQMHFGGEIEVIDDVIFSGNCTAHFDDGTAVVKILPGKTITIIEEAAIHAIGASFIPKDTSKWGGIILNNNYGNSFSNCTFDGAYNHVKVYRNTNNNFDGCTFTNAATAGIYTYQGSATPVSFTVDNCSFTGNWIGIYAKYASGSITNNFFELNDFGLYMGQSRFDNFHNNYIRNNYSSGICIDYSSQAIWCNDIINNGGTQVYINGWSTACGSNNNIYVDGYQIDYPPNAYIRNFAYTYNCEEFCYVTQDWRSNYWGRSQIEDMYTWYLFAPMPWTIDYSDYCTSPVSNRVASVVENISKNTSPVIQEILTEGIAKSLGNETRIESYEKILLTISMLNNFPNSKFNSKRLIEIYFLQNQLEVKEHPEVKKTIMNIAKNKKERFEQFIDKKITLTEDEILSAKLTGEVSMLIEIDDMIKTKSFKEAINKSKQFEKYITNFDNQYALKSLKLDALQRDQKFDEGLEVINELKEMMKSIHVKTDFNTPMLNVLENELLSRTGRSKNTMFVKNTTGFSKATLEKEDIPLEFAMYKNFPNPFNPTTTITFSLPEESNVVIEVYDMTGKLVSLLAKGDYIAGEHFTRFDGSGLASGVYLVNSRITSKQASGKLYNFTQKIMLMK
ncbi:MAG: right-handed parallel beta-helix repeat-containing protein [Ignavibacteriales bacterium]|nr:right-handed parallel beta-helix repeat-containing protein [Ignavibacteriales bacterium]